MEEDFDASAWRDRLRDHRAEKDEFLATRDRSPIPQDDREGFDGLDYFDPDPDLRVVARHRAVADPEPVELEVTQGPPAEYLRAAVLGVDLAGDHHTLDAFRAEGEDSLFVPFTDASNGDETYHHGRYLDVDPGDAGDGDDVVVDFNLAYNPFCAYSDDFACALPPDGNHLPVAVRAGERAYE